MFFAIITDGLISAVRAILRARLGIGREGQGRQGEHDGTRKTEGFQEEHDLNTRPGPESFGVP
jgi:hypothetical protein